MLLFFYNTKNVSITYIHYQKQFKKKYFNLSFEKINKNYYLLHTNIKIINTFCLFYFFRKIKKSLKIYLV